MSGGELLAWLTLGGAAWVLAGRVPPRRSIVSRRLWLPPALAGGMAVAALAAVGRTAPEFAYAADRAAACWLAAAGAFALAAVTPARILVRLRWWLIAGALFIQVLAAAGGGDAAERISFSFPVIGAVVVTDVARLGLLVGTAGIVWRLWPQLGKPDAGALRSLLLVASCWIGSAAIAVASKDTGAAALTVTVLAAATYVVLGRAIPAAGLLSVAAASVVLAALVFPHAVRRITSFLATPGNDAIDQNTMALYASSSGGLTGHPAGARGLAHIGSTLDDDFLLAAIGRLMGLCGLLAVALFVVAAAWMCLEPVLRTDAPGFREVLGAGAAALLVAQFVFAAGGVYGLLPPTGIPVPLMTGSGTSLLAFAVLLGMVAGPPQRRVPEPRTAPQEVSA